MLGKAKINWKKESLAILAIILISTVVALGLWVFVEKKGFAPSGVDGLAIMLFDGLRSLGVEGVPLGVFTFALNAPLLIAAWFVLNRRYVIYTIVYIVVLSGMLILFDLIGCPQYQIETVELGGKIYSVGDSSLLIAAIFGGVVQGFSSFLLKMGGSAGGADVIGCMIQKKVPHKDVEKLIAYVSYVVVAISFFVYDFNINAVCLSAVVIFVCEKVTSVVLRSNRSAVKVEIVTDKAHVNEIKNYIIFDLHHSATLLKAKGGFSEEGKEMIVCLINYRQLPETLKKIKTFPNTFMYYADVTGVRGNFDFRQEDETHEDKMLLEQKKKQIEQDGKQPEKAE